MPARIMPHAGIFGRHGATLGTVRLSRPSLPGEAMLTYCQYVLAHPEDSLNRLYHDTEYGFPLQDDNLLFERLMLEINQAGLSWITILKKAGNFRTAYEAFDVAKVAAYEQADIDRLLADAGIIRNRLKVNAAITNARRIRDLQREHGSFRAWLDAHHPAPLDQW